MGPVAPLMCLTLLVGPGVGGATENVPAPSVLTTETAIAPLWQALETEERPDRLWTWGWAW